MRIERGINMEKIITLGINRVEKEAFEKHSRDTDDRWYLNKPTGSLWGSTYTPDDEYVSDWERWCDANGYAHYNNGIIYTLTSDARIYTIDSLHDFIELLTRYPLPEPTELRMAGTRVYLDFSKIMKDYDVLHLTRNGNCETHLIWNHPEIDVGGKKYRISDLNSWDIESWLILNFDSIDLDSVELYEKKLTKEMVAEEMPEIL